MKEHKGMRPHDVIILLKVSAKQDKPWYMKDLAYELGISASEISESLHRSSFARLISSDKTRLIKSNLLDFLVHGLPYVYPQRPGSITRGVATAFSAPPLSNHIYSDDVIVWPFSEGNIRGQAIEPLHPNLPLAVQDDLRLYELAALCDCLRIGRAREREIAEDELRRML